MTLSKKELEVLIDKYDKEAEKNFRNYQETGMSRFERAYKKAEDLADSLRMALDAEDEHRQFIYYRGIISQFGHHARMIKDPDEAMSLLKSIIAFAVSERLIREE